MLFPKKIECGSDAHRNQHHPTNCAGAEDQQVNHRPVRVANCCENEERDCGRTRESVNDSNNQWTQLLIESDSAKYPVQPRQRSLMAVGMCLRPVPMSMVVDVIAVNMGMGMNHVGFFDRGSEGTRRAHEARNIHAAQYDQHESDGELHGKADARGYDHIKKNDGATYNEDGQSMANAPKDPGERGSQQIALPANDGGHGNHVIGIGGMAHSEKKSHRDYGEKTDHGLRFLPTRLLRPCGIRSNAS